MANRLAKEASLYLLSHSKNPVDWFPWGEEAINKATEEQKLLIISIGYSACHWCHVMEKESFEDQEVAELMNAGFVSIKVDREEYPDVDAYYMDAALLMNRSGGWPLNIIALPDKRAVFAGTYFPKDVWIKILSQINDYWINNRELVYEQGTEVFEQINRMQMVTNNHNRYALEYNIDDIILKIINQTDFEYGGFKGSPKFPMPVVFDFLCDQYFYSADKRLLSAVDVTLKKMASGGIYDQIGGGFARYSTDTEWRVPHFEKMLYDNALLVKLYAKFYALTKNELFKKVIIDTINFVDRELTSEENLYYSALDADSDGIEGSYYIWDKKEIEQILGNDSESFCYYYSVTEDGNWENKNILYLNEKSLIPEQLEILKQKLLQHRRKRIPPALDDKIIVSWNALYIDSLFKAGNYLGEKKYITMAVKSLDNLLSRVYQEDQLYRIYKNGRTYINAFLEDYSYLIETLITAYQSTFDEKYFTTAKKMSDYLLINFLDENTGLFRFTNSNDLPGTKFELLDNVLPSANAKMFNNLFILYNFTGDKKYLEFVETALEKHKNSIIKSGIYGAGWFVLLSKINNSFFQIVISGENKSGISEEFLSNQLPNICIAAAKENSAVPLCDGKPDSAEDMIYFCKNNVCYQPSGNIPAIMTQIKPLYL